MAETDFILSEETQNALLAFLLENDLTFIPSLDYENPFYAVLNTVEDINGIINSNKLTGPIFLPKKKINGYDLIMGHIIKNGKDIYYIKQRRGSPCLDLLPSELKTNFNPPLITSGFISYYSSYFIDEAYTEIKVPDWIKIIYKEANKILGQRCKKVKTKSRWYWVDKELIPYLGSKYATNVPNLNL